MTLLSLPTSEDRVCSIKQKNESGWTAFATFISCAGGDVSDKIYTHQNFKNSILNDNAFVFVSDGMNYLYEVFVP